MKVFTKKLNITQKKPRIKNLKKKKKLIYLYFKKKKNKKKINQFI